MVRIIAVVIMLVNIVVGTVEAKEKFFINILNQLSFDKAVEDVCSNNPQTCIVLKDKQIYRYLKKNFKPALLAIAYQESKFKYKYGKIDRNDRGYFQINIRHWSPRKIKKYFNIDTTIWSITHRPKQSAEIALRIWLYNVSIYILQHRRFPKNITEYISLYHSPARISRNYSRKVRKVVFRYINLFPDSKNI